MIEYKVAESTVKPSSIDTTSSKVYNYVRKNITELTDSEGNIRYSYEEVKVLKSDWDQYYNELAKDIEISELKSENEQLTTDVTDLQMAIAEMYETLSV